MYDCRVGGFRRGSDERFWTDTAVKTRRGVRLFRIFGFRVGSRFVKRPSNSKSSNGKYLVGMDLWFIIVLLAVEQ